MSIIRRRFFGYSQRTYWFLGMNKHDLNDWLLVFLVPCGSCAVPILACLLLLLITVVDQ